MTPLTNISAEFLKRSQSLMKGMRNRFGNILPFELDEFRAWLLAEFGGDEKSAKRCPYCNRAFIDVFNCQIDHRHPVSRGGALHTSNLIACCGHCNDVKGALGAEAFLGLLKYLQTIDPFDAQEIMRRLEICYKLAASREAMKRGGRAEYHPYRGR